MVLKLDRFDYWSLPIDCLAQLTVILAHLMCDFASLSFMLPNSGTCTCVIIVHVVSFERGTLQLCIDNITCTKTFINNKDILDLKKVS